LAAALAGAVIVETVFAWPGLEQLAVQAIEARDFPAAGIGAAGIDGLHFSEFLADILYSVVDPRIKLEGRDS
jgi:peptide/nickel transport system permease protein